MRNHHHGTRRGRAGLSPPLSTPPLRWSGKAPLLVKWVMLNTPISGGRVHRAGAAHSLPLRARAGVLSACPSVLGPVLRHSKFTMPSKAEPVSPNPKGAEVRDVRHAADGLSLAR